MNDLFSCRYNELQMFDFPRNVVDIDLTSTKNLCVALEEDSSHKNEILIFQLPSALQPKSNSGFTKLERHLSFDHGYFTESPLVQVAILLIISYNKFFLYSN